MKVQNLQRLLMIEDPKDLSFYRNGDLLQKKIYEYALDQNYRKHLGFNILDILNETFYQVARVFDDPSPEADIEQQYMLTLGFEWCGDERIPDEKSYFIFTLVHAILFWQAELPEQIATFDQCLRILLEGCSFLDDAEKFVDLMIQTYGALHSDLRPDPSPFIDYKPIDIKEITNIFDRETIERLIRRFRTKDTQLAFMSEVENSYFKFNPNEKPVELSDTDDLDDLPF